MELVVAGPVNELGYGVVCANVIHALRERGHEVYWRPWPPESPPPSNESLVTFAPPVSQSVLEAYDLWMCRRPKDLWHLHVYHEWELGGDWDGPTVGMPFFETQPIRRDAINPLRSCARVVVTSGWARDVLAADGIDADVVVYPGYDPTVYFDYNLRKPKNKFIYLHVGKFERRKGVDLVIKAFGRICNEYEDAHLWLLSENPFNPRWYGEYLSYVVRAGAENDRIAVLSRRASHTTLARLYNSVHAGIQPSRGEGFGLPGLEMLACGLPVAATACTGQGAYVPALTPHVIPTRGLEEAYDGVFFDGTRKWHTVGVDDVEQAMRDLRESPQDARRPLDFTWDAGAKRLAEYLEAL